MTETSGFPVHSPLQSRQAGVLLHPTSLPGSGDHGELGADAYRFVDFLAAAGQQIWQILPLGPTHEDGSPYQCLSAHAGNPALISFALLQTWDWLETVPSPRESRAAVLAQVRAEFEARHDTEAAEAYRTFLAQNAGWLDDFALFMVLKDENGGRAWHEWPAPERDREAAALTAVRERHREAFETMRFAQFLFYRQWSELKRYANERGIRIFGDMPIFVAHDSADVWAERQCFNLDEGGRPTVVAGVPPDYFSATGQRWGNPHYDWEWMEADGFSWWMARMETQLRLFDLVRVDHFRGFEAYWEIPAYEETAINGRWVKAPGDALFGLLRKRFDPLPIVAEDLGIITPEVEALRHKYSLPGMKILQFAFGGGAGNPYLPHNHQENSVVYTGTHDNDTTVGWYEALEPAVSDYVLEYLGRPRAAMPWPLIESAYRSVARLAVVPMQDLLGLDASHRMNTPGTTEGNWGWRFDWEMVPETLAGRVRQLCEMFGRR